eukprot:g80381.t1
MVTPGWWHFPQSAALLPIYTRFEAIGRFFRSLQIKHFFWMRRLLLQRVAVATLPCALGWHLAQPRGKTESEEAVQRYSSRDSEQAVERVLLGQRWHVLPRLAASSSSSSPDSALPAPPASTASSSSSPSPPKPEHFIDEDAFTRPQGPLDRLQTAVVTFALGMVAWTYMFLLNETTIYNGKTFVDCVLNRPRGRALVSVMNHVSAVDDPAITAALLPLVVLADHTRLRWILGASDRCFHRPAMAWMSRHGKICPIVRGEGLDQFGIRFLLEQLAQGKWALILPEGTRSVDGLRLGTMKPGVGKLVTSARDGTGRSPIVLPVYHRGMHHVLPKGQKLPGAGHKVGILVGQPMSFDVLLEEHARRGTAKELVFQEVADRIGAELDLLRQRYNALHGIREGDPESGSALAQPAAQGSSALDKNAAAAARQPARTTRTPKRANSFGRGVLSSQATVGQAHRFSCSSRNHDYTWLDLMG